MSKSKFVPVVLRQANGYDTEEASNAAVIPASEQGESLTIQSQSEDADINVLMERYGITGKMPENPKMPVYGDFTGINDFAGAMQAVMEAQDSFMELPAKVRARFENDPQKLLEFFGDPANHDEAEKLGLFSAEAVAKREKARVEANTKAAEAAARAAQAAKAPGVT